MKDVKPDELRKINAKALWVVIRSTKTKENPEKYIRKEFPGWTIVNLSYPLRTSKTISEQVKSKAVLNDLHTNQFNKSLKLVSNLPLGPKPLIVKCGPEDSYSG